MKPTIEDLKGLVEAGVIPKYRADFATSLVQSYDKYNNLTPKQMYWVGKIVMDTLNDSGPERKKLEGFQAVTALFDQVYSSGKDNHPKLKFDMSGLPVKANIDLKGMPLQLYRAGSKSKTPGWLQVTDGKPFGQNKWYGRISPEGEFEVAPKYQGSEEIQAVIECLTYLAKDPHAVAMTYGKKTGTCCFCSRKLTSKNSVAVGYGPVCAEKWGLYEHWIMAAEVAE